MKIAVIRCHSRKDSGAENFEGTAEYDYYAEVNTKIIEKLNKFTGVQAQEFLRDGTTIAGVGENVTEWGANLSIENHFNSYSETITGRANTECIVPAGCLQSKLFGNVWCRKMEEAFGFGLRADQGLIYATSSTRGGGNVNSINLDIPRLLCEPLFFNKDTHEARLFLANKDRYVDVCVDSIAEMLKLKQGEEPMPTELNLEKYSRKFRNLVCTYVLTKSKSSISALIPITVAQWILESGRGSTELAEHYNNFGGLKWRKVMTEIGSQPVVYAAHDGKTEYCKFRDVDHFIQGYWRFLQRDVYEGWEKYLDQPEKFMKYIVDSGYCPEPSYYSKVISLLPEAKKLVGYYSGQQSTPSPASNFKDEWNKLMENQRAEHNELVAERNKIIKEFNEKDYELKSKWDSAQNRLLGKYFS